MQALVECNYPESRSSHFKEVSFTDGFLNVHKALVLLDTKTSAGKLLSDAEALKALQSEAVCCRMHEPLDLHLKGLAK